MREFKGNSSICFPQEYVMIDLETTGLDTRWDGIIEMSAIKVRNDEVIDLFSELVKIENSLSGFITELTGITDEILSTARTIEEVLPDYLSFIGNNIVIGHNVNFDVNFIYDNSVKVLNKPFSNDFVDTLRISRKLLRGLKHHRLSDIIDYFKIGDRGLHRGLNDCSMTIECFNKLKEMVNDIPEFIISFKKKSQYSRAKDISISENIEIDETHPLYNQCCVFTGVLEKMLRKDAMQLVVNIGGKVADNVTAKTNYLVLGNNDYCTTIKDGKSSKQKKAEKLKLEGKNINIISENVFYDMIEF